MKHILFELRGCPSELLNDSEFVVLALQIAASRSKSRIVGVNCHEFKPQGVTAIAILAESHISIHTWPENHIAKCDIFCCGEEAHPREAVQYLHGRFKSKEVRRWVCDRSSKILTVL